MGKLPYLLSKTEQKQRGYIIANEFGGPLDISSWVAYKDNLDMLPNIYEGKIVYVYEDNQIYVCTECVREDDINKTIRSLKWTQLTNTVKYNDGSNTRFVLKFYEGNSPTSTDVTVDNTTHPDTEIQARLYVEVDGYMKRFGNTYDDENIGVNDRRYNKGLSYEWYVNNMNNLLVKVSDTREYKVNVVSDHIYSLSEDVYECGYIICVVKYQGQIIACNRIKYHNGKIDADDKPNGLYYLNKKSSLLQRGYLMANEQGGGIDATTSVNSVNDIEGFSNNYIGKLVYEYQSDEYLYYASNEGAKYTTTDKTQEEKVQYIKNNVTGSWNRIGTIDVTNNISYEWEITGKNYTLNHNGITTEDIVDEHGNTVKKILNIINEEDWRPDQLQERYDNGQMAEYEAHLYMIVNGVKTEVDRARTFNDILISGRDECGKVFFKWRVKKPTGDEYYDRDEDYDIDGRPIEDDEHKDQNRTVWIRNVDFTIDGNGRIKDRDGNNLDFKNSFYSTNTDIIGDDADHTLYEGYVDAYIDPEKSGTKSYQMDIIYTNDYDDPEQVELYCTAYFKDDEGSIRKLETFFNVSISSEHLVYVIPDNKGNSGIKSVNPDNLQFVIDGGSGAVLSDFTLNNNEYKIGYGIMHYENEEACNTVYYPTNHLNSNPSNGTLLYELYYNDNNNKVINSINLMEISEPTPLQTKIGTFGINANMLASTDSKIPFGWYRIFVFRRTYEDDLLYVSEPYHHFQTITNYDDFVAPEKIWLGYYQLYNNHTYQATVRVDGTNLLKNNIPIIRNGQIVKNYPVSVVHCMADYNNLYLDASNNPGSSLTVNSTYTQLNGIQPYTDPRSQYNTKKNRILEINYYDEYTDSIVPLRDSINVYNVMLPDLNPYINSRYKRPNNEDIFIYGTDKYDTLDIPPYSVPYIKVETDYNGSPVVDSVNGGYNIIEDDSELRGPIDSSIDFSFTKTYNGVDLNSTKPVLTFDGTFEIKASFNNGTDRINNRNIITDNYTSITGRKFSSKDVSILDNNNPAEKTANRFFNINDKFVVYDIKITIEQPSINNDSDYYESNRVYQLKSHIWYRTDNSDNWTEFTPEELGTVQYTWTENSGQDIYFSKNEELSHTKTATGTNTDDGLNNVWMSFYSDRMVFAYAKVTATLFNGYTITAVDEIKVRNPIDVLNVSHRIYSGNKEYKSYGILDTRQQESEWIELTVSPVLVDWFTWDDIITTLVFKIDGEVVDENSTKYRIEYEGTRNHYYEGTFKVYWKNESDMPDSTAIHTISLNKCNNEYNIPVNLVTVTGFHLYPLNHDTLNIGYPADDNIFINAKVGTSQRYILVIEGTGLDDDAQFLSMTKEGFTESLVGATSIPSTTQRSNVQLDSDGFKKVTDTSTKIVYYINDTATKNTLYTVKYKDAYTTHTLSGKTYVYNDESIKGFYTTSAYWYNANGTEFAFLDRNWINVLSSFAPSYSYQTVSVNKTVVDNTSKFTSSAEYDLHNIGIVSGNNVLVQTREDTKHSYSISISRSYDVFTAVIKDFTTDVSSTLPNDTNVLYSWSHTGPCIENDGTNTLNKNYLVLYNDSDNDVTENVSLTVTILYHGDSFTNWRENTLSISDYIMNASTNSENMPKLLYKIDFVKKNINLTIGKDYYMSDIFDSITTTMYRYDLDHTIEKITWTGSQLNDTTNTKLVFSAVNTGTKPSSVTDKKLKVTTDNGADLKVEWKRLAPDNTGTKATGTESFTSNVIKSSISINPSYYMWDLRVVPTIDTTITVVGQNLAYGYSIDNNGFLYVEESGNTNHKKVFNPNITSNDYGTYKYVSSYTDTGHTLGYNNSGTPINNETRTYNYKFGANVAAFSADYINRMINSITLSDKYVICNKTYGSNIDVDFAIDALNMFGPNVDINDNTYDLAWSSTPTGSTVTGTFTSEAGNVGEGKLTINTNKLTTDTGVSVSAVREGRTTTGSNTIRVAKITGISSNTSQTYVSDAKVTVTFTGNYLKSGGTYYLGIYNGSTYVTLGSGFTASNDSTCTYTASLPDRTTYNASVARTIKVWMESGNVDGQYATHTFAAQNPSTLTLTVISGSISGNTVNCNVTTGTLSWRGTITGNYADGTNKVLSNNQAYSSNVSFSGTNCQKTGAVEKAVSTTWSVPASTYNSTNGASTTISGKITQSGDINDGTTYSTISCPSTGTASTTTLTASATEYVNWRYGGQVSNGTKTQTINIGTSPSYHQTSNKTGTYTFSNLGNQTCTVTFTRDTYHYGGCNYTSLDDYYPSVSTCNGSTRIYAYGTCSNAGWESDGVSYYDDTDYCDVSGSNCNTSTSTTETGTCHGMTYYLSVPGDELIDDGYLTSECSYCNQYDTEAKSMSDCSDYSARVSYGVKYSQPQRYKYGGSYVTKTWTESLSDNITATFDGINKSVTVEWGYAYPSHYSTGEHCCSTTVTWPDSCFVDPCEDDSATVTYGSWSAWSDGDKFLEIHPGSGGTCPCECLQYKERSRSVYKNGKLCDVEREHDNGNIIMTSDLENESYSSWCTGEAFYISCLQQNEPITQPDNGSGSGGSGGGSQDIHDNDDPVNPYNPGVDPINHEEETIADP